MSQMNRVVRHKTNARKNLMEPITLWVVCAGSPRTPWGSSPRPGGTSLVRRSRRLFDEVALNEREQKP